MGDKIINQETLSHRGIDSSGYVAAHQTMYPNLSAPCQLRRIGSSFLFLLFAHRLGQGEIKSMVFGFVFHMSFKSVFDLFICFYFQIVAWRKHLFLKLFYLLFAVWKRIKNAYYKRYTSPKIGYNRFHHGRLE